MLESLIKKVKNHQPKKQKEELKEAAVLMTITNNSDNPHFVLTLRAAHLSSHAGQVSFPGGKKDDTDQNLVETALRESFEEVGLQSDVVNVVGEIDQFISINRLKVTPIVGIVPEEQIYTPNYSELDSIFKVPLSFFLEKNDYTYDIIPYEGVEYKVHHFHYQDYDIWGLTAVMIMRLLNICYDANFEINRKKPRSI
ncbi:MAG: 8-oxo-dGTP pyrophosphatase MutT (NUDIX family) [bacterium]|jgi:8-oxo-dGTP pyrophosphatase MutT (NUDIX family)